MSGVSKSTKLGYIVYLQVVQQNIICAADFFYGETTLAILTNSCPESAVLPNTCPILMLLPARLEALTSLPYIPLLIDEVLDVVNVSPCLRYLYDSYYRILVYFSVPRILDSAARALEVMTFYLYLAAVWIRWKGSNLILHVLYALYRNL